MKKRMTLKEFKEVFNRTSMDFDLWGWEGILNFISVTLQSRAEEYERKGMDLIAAESKSDSDVIYYALLDRGYYDYRGEVE